MWNTENPQRSWVDTGGILRRSNPANTKNHQGRHQEQMQENGKLEISWTWPGSRILAETSHQPTWKTGTTVPKYPGWSQLHAIMAYSAHTKGPNSRKQPVKLPNNHMPSNILEASLRNPNRSDHSAPEPAWHPSIRTERKSIWVSRYRRPVTDRQGAKCRLQTKKSKSGYGMDRLQKSIWHSAAFLDNPKHGASHDWSQNHQPCPAISGKLEHRPNIWWQAPCQHQDQRGNIPRRCTVITALLCSHQPTELHPQRCQSRIQLKTRHKINHLLYMDDLKLYAKNEKNWQPWLRQFYSSQ